MMQALGMIETRGLVAAVESADAMLKAAEVRLVEKTLTGGGLVTVVVTGDVAACKASVDAATAAVKRLGGSLLISTHVIPRPHETLSGIVVSASVDPVPKEIPARNKALRIPSVPETGGRDEEEMSAGAAEQASNAELTKKMLDGMETKEVIKRLEKTAVLKLRRLAREYSDLKIAGREISKADKETLMSYFRKYYKEETP